MKTKITVLALAVIAALTLASCQEEPAIVQKNSTQAPTINTQRPTPSVVDAGTENTPSTTTDVADAGTENNANTPEALPPNVFKDVASGTTIMAPKDTVMVPWAYPAWAYPNKTESIMKEILTTTSFKRPNGNTYTALVFKREANETLDQWSSRTGWGDAGLPGADEPNAHLVTKSGQQGYIYETGDLGLLPSNHIVVATENFVYRFQWNDPRIPKDGDAAVAYLKAHDKDPGSDEYWKVPQDFIEFVKSTEVN